LTGTVCLDEARALNPAPRAILIAGDGVDAAKLNDASATVTPEIRIWDFEVGRRGTGAFASAVGGVSSVIGAADGPPGMMPAFIPEKWAGMLAASLALALCFTDKNGQRPPRTIDVSAADILRAYSEQNSGNHAGVPYGWRRNGRTAVEHGGVFPQGFFPCGDGHLAVQARSRQDWQNILAALGKPEWAIDQKFQNPFKLSLDDEEVTRLLNSELKKHTRKEWLNRALETGAPMAPVFNLEEACSADVFRAGFINQEGAVNAPFVVRRV
jgi:crotonobetainyl-CoA:carnitine CoA-transferase CaiB-like acyl-CoA transferase